MFSGNHFDHLYLCNDRCSFLLLLLFFFYSNLFVIFIYLNNIIFTTHNIITKVKIYGIKERNTAYKLIDNYILSIKIKLNLNQMKYLKHLPFLFKLADLICLKGYVFLCFIFDFQKCS